MTSCSQCSKNYCLASATTPCRCVGWTWPNSDCYIIFFSLPNYIMWCVTGVFPQSSFLDSEANRRCSLKAKENETKLKPIRGMTEHFCGLMISPPHPCQNPGRAEWFESHGPPRWLLSATCVHHRSRPEPGWCSCGESPVSPDECADRKKGQINTLQCWREK